MSAITHWREIAEQRSIPEPNSGCWLWLGAIESSGYGILMEPRDGRGVRARRKQFRVIRLVCEVGKGQVVRHTCDVPLCVNPAHLLPGTHAENMHDMAVRGRSADFRADRNPNAKLTLDAVAEIRANRRYGMGGVLAAKYGVSVSSVRRAWRGASW